MSEEIKIPSVVRVRELAELFNKPVNDVITVLVRFGVMANINEDIDFDTASIVADEFGLEVKEDVKNIDQHYEVKLSKTATLRPPVVTVMGHVDHGKTTVLDYIRKTDVAGGEAGGITQAITSYQVQVANVNQKNKPNVITFVDTPGHSAFETMRQHGVSITDMVVLVVAANDGVKPQTIETIKHVNKYKVPVIVAINKIDLPDANVEATKRQLADLQLVPEEWGGEIKMIEISAKNGQGIDKLITTIKDLSEKKQFKADDEAKAAGVVIESHMESGLGPVATVLIQNGTLKISDPIVVGRAYGKVRSVDDFKGKRLRQATASMPVVISGLSLVPSFGERLIVVNDEKEAKEIARQNGAANQREKINKQARELSKSSKKVAGRNELLLIIKADTRGSLNAITDLANNVSNDDVKIKIVKEATGEIGDDDIKTASATGATIIVFNQKIAAAIKKLAQEAGVSIHSFKVIYEVEQLITKTVEDLMPEVEVENTIGKLKILKRFGDNRKNIVVGGLVQAGSLSKDQPIRVKRGSQLIAEGVIVEVRTGKETANQVSAGSECGLEINIKQAVDNQVVTDKDIVEAIRLEKVKKTL